MNALKLFITVMVIITASLCINACLPIDKNGKVAFLLKDNQPCFYIKDTDYKGEYEVSITQYDTAGERVYRTTYEKHYPNKENCIIYNEANFISYTPILEYTNYFVKINSEKQSKRKPASNHGVPFCLIRQNGQLTIIEPEHNCQLYKK